MSGNEATGEDGSVSAMCSILASPLDFSAELNSAVQAFGVFNEYQYLTVTYVYCIPCRPPPLVEGERVAPMTFKFQRVIRVLATECQVHLASACALW